MDSADSALWAEPGCHRAQLRLSPLESHQMLGTRSFTGHRLAASLGNGEICGSTGWKRFPAHPSGGCSLHCWESAHFEELGSSFFPWKTLPGDVPALVPRPKAPRP